jgi:hypothetical protein
MNEQTIEPVALPETSGDIQRLFALMIALVERSVPAVCP